MISRYTHTNKHINHTKSLTHVTFNTPMGEYLKAVCRFGVISKDTLQIIFDNEYLTQGGALFK